MAMQSQSAMSSAADGTDSTQASRGRPKFALVNRDGPPQAIRTVFNSVPNLVQRAVSESKSQAFRNKLRANIPGGVLRMDAPVRSGGMMGPQVEAATLVLTQAYIYDSYNRRTLTIPFETPEASQFHTYDGWRQAGQYYWGLQGTDAVAVPNKQFVWGSRLDELISYRRWNPDLSTPAWENYFVLHGGQDTAAKLVSDAGTLVEQYEYDPYGKASVYVGSSTTPTEVSSVGLPFLWKGIRLDGETGLLYMRYRYYSAQSGRFLSQDPIGVWGDAVNWGNGYGYVGNNPLNRRDPYGLFYVTLDHRRCIATLRYTLQLFMHGFPDEATKAAWAAAAKAVIERDWNTNTVTLMPPPTLRVSMCCCLWSQEISHPCPGGYRMRVEVTIIVEGTDWSDDNEADVTWLPLGAWRLSSTSGNGATATLDSNDIVPTTGRTQAAISHEFGHMLGLDHPSAGLPGVAPNSAPEYNDPTTGTPSSNIMGVGSDVGPENAGPWLQNLPSGWSAH
jgi:RHS repeat-associated protein